MGNDVLNGISGPLLGLASQEPVYSLDSRILEALPDDGVNMPFWSLFNEVKDCYLEPLIEEELQMALNRMEREGKVSSSGEASGATYWCKT